MCLFSSCNGFLDILPETSLTPENFFETQSDFEQAVAGIYAPLRTIYDRDWVLTEMRSDNTHFVYNIGQRGPKPEEDPSTFTIETNNRNTAAKWSNNYLIISRANEVLGRIDNAEFDGSSKGNLKGQALFLRAFAYFDLVKNFGGVPLFLQQAESYADTFRERSDASQIYDQIIKDLEEAITLLPADAGAIGRVTSGAARTVLADVFLGLKRWSDVEQLLLPLTNGQYGLLSNYRDIFDPANKGNREVIFEIQYAEGTSQALHNYLPYRFIPVLTDPSVITGVSPASTNGDGCYNTPTPDLLDAYEEGDKRLEASIGFYSGSSPLIGVVYNNTPYIRKYMYPHARYGQTAQNWPVYRYAEVLLMLAEALNEQGKTGEALEYLNGVRVRAGLSPLSINDVAGLREKIFKERRIEFAFENKRWRDLVRSGQAVEVMNNFGRKVISDPAKYYYPEGAAPPPNAYQVSDKDLIYPIPIDEIIINPSLRQNPGYQ